MTLRPPLLVPVLQSGFPRGPRLDLLKACLLDGEAARAAFVRWTGNGDDARRRLGESTDSGRLLAAMLFRAIQRGGWDLNPALRTHLKIVGEHEDRRSKACSDILDQVATLLTANGLTVMALKGAAYTATDYPEPGLRHSHDLDLMLPAGEIGRAGEILRQDGFTNPPDARLDEYGLHRTWLHPSGLPVQLHEWPFRIMGYSVALRDMWERCRPVAGARGRLRVPSAEDALVHGLVHATTGSHRETMVWVADMHFVSQGVRDWPLVASLASRTPLALPASAALHWMRNEFSVPVPPATIATVDAAAKQATRFDRDVALHGQLPGRIRMWSAATRLGERADIVRWTILPSREYLAWRTGARGTAMPLAYVWRLLRPVLRRVVGWPASGATPKDPAR